MEEKHETQPEEMDNGIMFICDECGYMRVVKNDGKTYVVSRGNQKAFHFGTFKIGLSLTVEIDD